MKYIRLKDNFALRGWYGLPWAIMEMRTGQTVFMNKEIFAALQFCKGDMDVDSLLCLPSYRKQISEGLRSGILEECERGEGLKPEQEYIKYDTRYVKEILWSITGRCNLNCRHCYLCAPDAQYGELSTAECLKIIDQIAAAGISRVMITGGEPLTRSDFWQIVDALLAKNIIISQLYTNGLLVDDAFIEQCKIRGLKWDFVLSHDGVGCHDWMRGLEGTEEITVESMKRIKRAGFRLLIESALHADNLDSFVETYELMKEVGVDSWKTSPIMDTGNWENEAEKKEIELSVLYGAYLDMIRRYRADGMPLSIMLGGMFFNRKGEEEWSIPFERFSGDETCMRETMCGSCRLHLYLLPDGRMLPCIPMTGSAIEKDMPNVFEHSISEIMMDSLLFETVNTRLEGILNKNKECADCQYALLCGGGCKACALLESDSIYGKDSAACYFFKNDYSIKVRAAIKNCDMH